MRKSIAGVILVLSAALFLSISPVHKVSVNEGPAFTTMIHGDVS
ncbi:hypothetical protein GCM10010969_07510 [Saccharibacillus kuerlensis]|uniref:Phr family secreted Rap phosphatase inhibitor n=1 Tax=Saccharibacillus kuerlensis TaxID=459527 RepID=A0ABQ2KUA9_9BACL|nr:hypothetical protein GCM10010969_07510 [Saccharibacillus kuerlensis]